MATTLTFLPFFRLGERSLGGRLGGLGDEELSMLDRIEASMWIVTGLVVRGGAERILTGTDCVSTNRSISVLDRGVGMGSETDMSVWLDCLFSGVCGLVRRWMRCLGGSGGASLLGGRGGGDPDAS